MKQANDESSNQPCASGLSPRSKRHNLAARSRWWLICWGLVAACLASATTTRAEVITLSADQDASALGWLNYNDPENEVGYRNFGYIAEFRAAIRFPLPAALDRALIQSATLKLYYFDVWGSFDNRSVRAHRMLQFWSETDVFFDAPRDGSFAETSVGGTNFRWISWDVTAAARLWAANSATNFGIMLVADPAGSSDNAFRFYSREFADPAYRPVLEVTYLIPPQFTQQPQSQTVPAGTTVSLTASATGSPPLYYQWWKDGQPVAGATSANLSFASTRSTNTGVYSVVVSNAASSLRSADATITVTLPSTDFSGGVTVNITPPESVATGAKWRVNSGDWLNSGQAAANVLAGSRLVEFKPVAGWKNPAPFQIRVIGNHFVSNTVSYTPVANLNLGGIPTQRVYEGTPAEFRVRSDELGAGATLAIITGTPPPAGALTFDPATGLFRYVPTASDKQPFSVTFTATLGTNTVSQVVSFQPVPGLPPERAVFGLTPGHALPSDESKDYISVNTILGDAPEPFNHQVRTTRAVTVSGKTVVFQPGHANGLYDAYNGNDDLKEMNIHAETLIVRSPLRLPQTAVTIYARELRFEGADAKIDTTPRSLTTRPAQRANGAHGLKAGDITT